MRIATIPAAAMLVVGLTVVSAFAGQHGHPTTLHGSSAKSLPHTQPATQGQAHVTPTTTTTTTRSHGNPHTTSVSTTPATTTTSAHGNKHTVSSSTTPTTTATTQTTPTTTTTNTTPTTTTTRSHGNARTTSTTTTTTTTTNPIASKISSHPQQAARIERM